MLAQRSGKPKTSPNLPDRETNPQRLLQSSDCVPVTTGNAAAQFASDQKHDLREETGTNHKQHSQRGELRRAARKTKLPHALSMPICVRILILVRQKYIYSKKCTHPFADGFDNKLKVNLLLGGTCSTSKLSSVLLLLLLNHPAAAVVAACEVQSTGCSSLQRCYHSSSWLGS